MKIINSLPSELICSLHSPLDLLLRPPLIIYILRCCILKTSPRQLILSRCLLIRTHVMLWPLLWLPSKRWIHARLILHKVCLRWSQLIVKHRLLRWYHHFLLYRRTLHCIYRQLILIFTAHHISIQAVIIDLLIELVDIVFYQQLLRV